MKKILLFAAFIYFLLGTFTFHPDNKVVLSWASLEHGKVWDFWNLDKNTIERVGLSNYPPLHLYIDKIQYFLSIPFGGSGYYEWLSNNIDYKLNPQDLSQYSFAIKMPLMLFTFAAAFLIYKITKNNDFSEKQSKLAAGIFLFNPITLYSIPIMGQNDIMSVFFFLLGWYLLQKKKLIKSTIFFGAATAIKMFPIIWLPFLLFYEKGISVKKRVGIIFGALLTYLLTLLPFLSNPVFRKTVLSTGIDRFFVAKIDLGYEDFVLIVPVLIMVIILGVYKKVENVSKENKLLMQSSVLLLFNMVFLFFNHFNPQWFLWIVPFYILWFMYQNKSWKIISLISLIAVGSWILALSLIKDAALILGLLSPLNYSLSSTLSIKEILEAKSIDVFLYNNYAHTFLAGTAIVFLVYWLGDKESVKEKLNINFEFKIKLNKFVRYFGVLIFSFLLVYSASVISYLIPIPLNDPKPVIREYPFMYESVEHEFTVTQERFNRVDLFFSDDELKNFDDYIISLYDSQETLIAKQKINGFNVGYRTPIQFSFPQIIDSENKTYKLIVTVPEYSEEPLRIASTTQEGITMAVQPYYAKPRGKELIGYVLEKGFEATRNVIAQNVFVYILMLILLWFSL